MSEANDHLKVPVLTVRQPIGEFYVGVIPASQLRIISYADRRRQIQVEDAIYAGIQRELSEKRRAEIRKYIRSFDASFPNSFIIAVRSEDVVSEENGILILRNHPRTACIIDGQHRLSGFDETNEEGFDLLVSIFIDLPQESQAMLFATINLKQTRVNESLVYDLFEETTTRSPQKTSHEVAKSLNRDNESPFFEHIKPLGKRTNEYEGRISQATFIKKLLPLIAKDPDSVRDAVRRGIKLAPDDSANQDCPFWSYFVEGKDWAIQKVINNYFKSIGQVFPNEWDVDTSALGKTIGFGAFMTLLLPVAKRGLRDKRLDVKYFNEILGPASRLAPLTMDKYPASGAGENKLARELKDAISA